MAIYLKLFETTSQYNAYTADTANFIKPNVSLIEETNTVEYNPYVPETRVVAKYNVTESTKTQMILGYYQTGATTYAVTTAFTSVYVDGNEIEISDANINYTFDTVGEHTVKYELNNPTAIKGGAFYGTLNGNFRGVEAVSITIPNSVTSIGTSAFTSCGRLTSITIGSGVTSIDEYAFSNCTSLTSIDIPNSVTSIGHGAFNNTPWWNTYSADTSHHYGNIIYINDVAYKATSTGITSTTLREGTLGIGGSAFFNCTSLTNIIIPDAVTSIGKSAFAYCSGLTSITSNATTAPTISSGTFENVKTGGTLYVPQGSSGYNVWMGRGNYYLGKYNWTKVEQ